ncbi:MAG: hypothetical protein EZS28_005679 [Streblomastix strix]|uniref:Uncharacterized protein n=1 Tax=Streblomastix strix TaxID=222440 RepID=A0A5J4WWA4_9EUKA|nr:MAG: hypothetical protein EZS28_005679 [Streblomastix strix]
MAIGGEEEEAEWLNVFLRPRKEEVFWIHPPIPKIEKVLIVQEKFKLKSIMIASWWSGQIWFTHLLTSISRYLIFGESYLILNQGKKMMKKNDMLQPWKIAVFIIDHKQNKEENY